MKKLMLILIGLAGTAFAAQAQLENTSFILPPEGGPIIVGGAAPIATPVVYDQGVTYNAPVQYYAPVQYNGPVYYNTSPYPPTPVPCVPPVCANYSGSTIQVIPFGRGQAVQQGYNFTAVR
jgi:hypothetical protein